jgi:hypothetical protein
MYMKLFFLRPAILIRETNFFMVKVEVVSVLFLNWAPRHAGVLGSSGIAPRIIDLGIRWRWVVASRPGRFTPRERAPGTCWIGGWVGPRAGLDAVACEVNLEKYKERQFISLCLLSTA